MRKQMMLHCGLEAAPIHPLMLPILVTLSNTTRMPPAIIYEGRHADLDVSRALQIKRERIYFSSLSWPK